MRRGRFYLLSLLMVTAGLVAGPASGQDPGHEGGAPKHGASTANHEPAADDSPFSGEAHQILDLAIWTVVVFLVLLGVLSKYAWKPMLAGLKKREDDIRSAVEEARKAREEAHRLHESLQAEMAQSAQKVHAMMDEARRDAERAKSDMIASARAEIQAERDRSHRELQVETDQALQSLWTRAAELATQVSAAALGRQLDGDAHRRLIDEALNELKTAANRGANGHA